MFAALIEMIAPFMTGYFIGMYRQGKMGLGKFFWLSSFVMMVSVTLLVLVIDYHVLFNDWIKTLKILSVSSFSVAFFGTALLWFFEKKAAEKP